MTRQTLTPLLPSALSITSRFQTLSPPRPPALTVNSMQGLSLLAIYPSRFDRPVLLQPGSQLLPGSDLLSLLRPLLTRKTQIHTLTPPLTRTLSLHSRFQT